MQLFTIIGTSFLLSCWSCNALPSVPAAFSIAVYQTMKSNFVWPWMYSVLKSIKIFLVWERNKKTMLLYHGTKADVQERNIYILGVRQQGTFHHIKLWWWSIVTAPFFSKFICITSVIKNERRSANTVTSLWKNLPTF